MFCMRLPPQVSLDSRVRETVNRNMADPTIHTFDEAQQQIYILMHRDSFPRFLNSKMFRRMVENASREKKWGAPTNRVGLGYLRSNLLLMTFGVKTKIRNTNDDLMDVERSSDTG